MLYLWSSGPNILPGKGAMKRASSAGLHADFEGRLAILGLENARYSTATTQCCLKKPAMGVNGVLMVRAASMMAYRPFSTAFQKTREDVLVGTVSNRIA
jgi:hypothetical protein